MPCLPALKTSDCNAFKPVITGFNTDIEHDGVVYHVQTEDKGLDSPLILSLVYSGGAILASKRSRYEDLIAAGFDEEVLSQRLKRQHRLICAAINAGRLEELKRMGSARPGGEGVRDTAPLTLPAEVAEVPQPAAPEVFQIETAAERPPEPVRSVEAVIVEAAIIEEAPPEAKVAKPRAKRVSRAKELKEPIESAYTVHDPRHESPFGEVAPEQGLFVTVLDEEEFQAGEPFTIRVLVEDRSGKKEKPLAGITVSVKILGTTFRPQIYSVKTQRDGVAIIDTTMPNFSSGRAAVLIRAVVKDQTTEVRRVIHPAA
jgi:hypothetical protein